MSKLHPDWPETDLSGASWEKPDPFGDIECALHVARGGRPLVLADLASVTDYSIRSDDGEWQPGGSIATELSMYILGTLKTGEWFALEAWNDYTGWGCQDGADLYIGPTREDVIANGVTNDGRSALGIT